MPTATWKSRLRSGSAHWDLELAVEVRQCPLGSGARGGGPAVPTGIWTARRRRRVRRRRRQRRRRRRRRTALIKSNNPHLAGGEKYSMLHIAMLPAIGLISLQVEEIDEIDLHDVPGPYIYIRCCLITFYVLCPCVGAHCSAVLRSAVVRADRKRQVRRTWLVHS